MDFQGQNTDRMHALATTLQKTKWLKWPLIALSILALVYLQKLIFAGSLTLLATSPFFLPSFALLTLLSFVSYKIYIRNAPKKPTAQDSETAAEAPPMSAREQALPRPTWAKYLGVLNIAILLLYIKWLEMVFIGMLASLAFAGALDRAELFGLALANTLLLFFIIVTPFTLLLAFRKKYAAQFSEKLQYIMFMPLGIFIAIDIICYFYFFHMHMLVFPFLALLSFF